MKRNRRRGAHPLVRTARALGRLFAAGAALGLGALVVQGVASWVITHPYFSLAAIEVRGERAASASAIALWAGIEPRASLWEIDPRIAEQRLRANARFRSARVERFFPDRITIAVEEREPVAIVLAPSGPHFVDADAQLFPPLDGEPLEGYPYVTGLPNDGEGTPAVWSVDRLRRALTVVALWNRRGGWPALSEIRPEESGEIVVFPEQNPMAIRFARELDAEQFARLDTVLTLWRGREAQVAGVDLTVPGQAVLRLRGNLPKPRESRGI